MAVGFRQPRGLLGLTMPGPIGGFGGGTFNMDGTQATGDVHNYAQAPAQPPKKHGGLGRTIGRIGDVLAVLGGREPVYGPMQQQNEAQDALAAYAANPEDQGAFMGLLMRSPELALRIKEGLSPRRNDTIDDFEWFKRLGPEDRAIYREMHPIYRQGADGQFYAVQPVQQNIPPDTLPADFDFGGGQPTQGQPPFDADAVFNALIQQESGGRAGALGQQTQYGQPLGMTQLLPGTAREMAGKLGLPWNPAMLRRNDPQSADYQRRLGRAYFEQGLRETGNVRDALHYYHGGPNRALWGPRTRRYADEVLGRLGGQ